MSIKRKRISLTTEETTTTNDKPYHSDKFGLKKAVKIIPRNIRQEQYLNYLMDPEKMIVLAYGPAGTGKTAMAMMAAIKALSDKKVNKIILTRPSVPVDGENLGFLPGDLNEKMEPWTRPLFDVIYEYYSKKEVESLVERGIIEICPLAYMRGRNLQDCFIVADEFQNASVNQCKMLCTRLCDGSKLIMTGDNDQTDKKGSENGLFFFSEAIKSFGGSKYISEINFDILDVQRHQVVSDVLDIFKFEGR